MRIHCQHLSKTYQTLNDHIIALTDVSFTIEDNEFICIVGPSGCGKSTLLKIIAGLQAPSSGNISRNPPNNHDRPINAMVFQEDSLYPWMTVLDNVAFGLEFKRMPRSERHEQALEFIEQVGLGDFAESYPNELSVGMRQRVSLARAFVARPQILLMDEPLAALDALTKHILQEDLLTTWSRLRPLIVYVTHDLTEAILLGDRVVIMSGRPGTILEEIDIPFSRPRNLQERSHPEIAEIERHLWSVLEAHVRHSMDSKEVSE